MKNRIRSAWNVLRNRPTMFNVSVVGPLTFQSGSANKNLLVVNCRVTGGALGVGVAAGYY